MFMECKARSGKHFKNTLQLGAESSVWELLCYHIFPDAMDLRVSMICAPESIFSGANSVSAFQNKLSRVFSGCSSLPISQDCLGAR